MNKLVLLALAGFIVFYAILQLPLSGVLKFALVCAEMIAINQYLIKKKGYPSETGFVLLKSKHGLEMMKNLAKHEEAWKFFADTGAVICYGALSFLIMRKNVNAKCFIAGAVAITLLSFFVGPAVVPFLSSVIGLDAFKGPGKEVSSISGDYYFLVLISLLYLGGFFLIMTLGLIGWAGVIVAKIASILLYGSVPLSSISAGATFLLPGVNMPLFEGIAALFIILVVHEGAHAVLSMVARVPVLSSGIVLFGVIPIGAFVEPDEARLVKAEKEKQTRVIVAGATSNMIAAIAFFAIFLIYSTATSPFKEEGLLVTAGMEKDTIIYSANGVAIDPYNYQGMNLPKNSEVTLETNKGKIVRSTNGEGKIGVLILPIGKSGMVAKYKLPAFEFFYVILGLTFALNFIIGTVNILPIPLFDGYRTLDINMKNKVMVKAIMALTFLAFVINLVPNLFGGI